MVKFIAENVDYKNPVDNYGNTPLHIAAEEGHLEIVKFFMENVDDKNPTDQGRKLYTYDLYHIGMMSVMNNKQNDH